VLLSLRCHICQAINKTTLSPFNHSGIVVAFAEDGSPLVAQSLTRAEVLPLHEFLAQAPRHSPTLVRRSKELSTLFEAAPHLFEQRAMLLKDTFAESFLGADFDEAYLWNNHDARGRELLYCSEMVQKLLNVVLGRPLPTIPLDYTRLWDFWLRYFDGQVPQGLPGNSPASLAAAPELMTL
jgi:hypothetical protein